MNEHVYVCVRFSYFFSAYFSLDLLDDHNHKSFVACIDYIRTLISIVSINVCVVLSHADQTCILTNHRSMNQFKETYVVFLVDKRYLIVPLTSLPRKKKRKKEKLLCSLKRWWSSSILIYICARCCDSY